MKEGQVGGDAAHFTVLKSLAEGWDGRFRVGAHTKIFASMGS